MVGVEEAAVRMLRAEEMPMGMVEVGSGPERGEAMWIMAEVPVGFVSVSLRAYI